LGELLVDLSVYGWFPECLPSEREGGREEGEGDEREEGEGDGRGDG
jgi:hypothetical protein